MFHYAQDFELLDRLPNMRKSLAKVPLRQLRKHKEDQKRANGMRLFTPAEIRRLIEHADLPLRAMILLGINGGFGNTDCAELRMEDVDLERGLIDASRPKTGIRRTVPLWPETIQALREVIEGDRARPKDPKHAKLVFLTRFGHPWVRVQRKDLPDGSVRITKDDEVAKQFGKLLNRVGLQQSGRGFYALRHTHATLADRAKDAHAQRRILGHAIAGMLGEYIEQIELDRLRAVVQTVRQAIFQDDQSTSGK